MAQFKEALHLNPNHSSALKALDGIRHGSAAAP
jgi:hypothetical protein